MAKSNSLTAVIIARNESQKIKDCLESVKFADETLVFDNDSTDKTVEIVQSFGLRTYPMPNGNFSNRKNQAFSKAKSDWILSLDADERVTPGLKNEILKQIANDKLQMTNIGAFAIPRKNIILGKEFKHGGQYPDYVVRLFKRSKFVEWKGELHEQPIIDGELGYLKNSLVHLKHERLSEMVEKTNEWSEVEAKLMFDAKHPPMNIFRFATAVWREFWLRFVKQKSFLDGQEGIIYALYQVFSRFLSYAKLWEMQLNNK